MADNIFEDLCEWLHYSYKKSDPIRYSDNDLQEALYELGIAGRGEVIYSKRIIEDWHIDSGDTYTTIVEIDLSNNERIKTIGIIAHAIVTPPGISLEDRLMMWLEQIKNLDSAGVVVPRWYLAWKGTAYIQYPPHKLVEYIQPETNRNEINDLASDLAKIFTGLSALSLRPLGLLHHLRTDGLRVYYCGLGFDIGASTNESANSLITEYEDQVLPIINNREFISEYKKPVA